MQKNHMSRKQQQAAETKKKLYESAAQLFERYNFEDVSVDAIVEAAGVSKGTFYVHFESKDALIVSLISDYVSKLDMDYRTHIDSLPPDMPASTVLLSLIEKIADVLTDILGYDRMKFVYDIQLTRTIDMNVVMGYNRDLYRMFDDVLGKGLDRGEFKTDLPRAALTRHFVMAIRGLSYEWCIRYPDFDLKQEALAHFKLLLTGLQPRTGDGVFACKNFTINS